MPEHDHSLDSLHVDPDALKAAYERCYQIPDFAVPCELSAIAKRFGVHLWAARRGFLAYCEGRARGEHYTNWRYESPVVEPNLDPCYCREQGGDRT